MAKLVRFRHGKHRTLRDLVTRGYVTTGASADPSLPTWQHFSLGIDGEDGSVYSLKFDRAECERIVRELTSYLERDTRRPINGTRHS